MKNLPSNTISFPICVLPPSPDSEIEFCLLLHFLHQQFHLSILYLFSYKISIMFQIRLNCIIYISKLNFYIIYDLFIFQTIIVIKIL